MTYAVRSHPSAYSRAPLARFGAALAASAVAHWILLSAPQPRLPRQGIAPISDSAPMTVRLAPLPALVPGVQVTPEPGARRMPLPARTSTAPPKSTPGGDSASGAQSPALPPAPDPNYYPARDLDDYPRPLTPLRIDRLAGDGAGEARLEVLIDERGIVRDVTVTAPALPARVEEALRAALVATRFLPAQKDGRAVRSRILLSVGFDPKDGER